LSHNGPSQKIKKITAETPRKTFLLLLTAPAARLTKNQLFLCASAVQSFDFVFNVSFWLKADPLKKF
jgi:hypothetical protein